MLALILLEIEYSYEREGDMLRIIVERPAIKWRTLCFVNLIYVNFNSLFTSSIKRIIKDAKNKGDGLSFARKMECDTVAPSI